MMLLQLLEKNKKKVQWLIKENGAVHLRGCKYENIKRFKYQNVIVGCSKHDVISC